MGGWWEPKPSAMEGTGAWVWGPEHQAGPFQGCLHQSHRPKPEALRGSEVPGLPSGSNSLGGNSRHTGHLMQAGCAPFSVNLLSGSACFHGDLTSEIFHLGCQMPVDEAKPPRVTKYRHSPTGSGGRASSGFGVGAWLDPPPPGPQPSFLEAAMLGLVMEVCPGPALPMGRTQAW